MGEIQKKNFGTHIPRKLHPEDLVQKTRSRTNDALPGFFLTLGLIFDDLKSIILIHDKFFELYETPNNKEPSVHLGEWSGIQQQFFKILTGILHEFSNFLSDERNVLESETFKFFENKLSGPKSDTWEFIKSIALTKEPKKHPFTNLML